MAETKSKSRSKKREQDAQQKETTRSADANTPASNVATSTRNTNNMSDAPSILEFSEDIATAEAPAPLPVGDYPAEIRGAELKTSASSGNRYVSVTFFIAPEAYPADFTEGNPDGMTLTFNRVPYDDTPVARHRVRKFCEAIGAAMGKKLNINDWIGLSATVSIDHDTYEGETRAQIKKVVAA